MSTSSNAYSQAYLLCGNLVDFVLFAKCLCSHNTTPHLPLPSMHIPLYGPSISYTHCVPTLHHTCRDTPTTNLFHHPTPNLQEPRTQHTSDIWRHHYGPGQRPCRTAELESTGQRNLCQSVCLGSTSEGREAYSTSPPLFMLCNILMAREIHHTCTRIKMIWNSTSQKHHRTMLKLLDSDVLTQSWVLISGKR